MPRHRTVTALARRQQGPNANCKQSVPGSTLAVAPSFCERARASSTDRCSRPTSAAWVSVAWRAHSVRTGGVLVEMPVIVIVIVCVPC